MKSFFTDLGQPSDYWSTTVEQYTRQDRPPDVRQGAAGQHVLGQSHPGEVGQRHQPRHRGGGGRQLAAHHRHQRRRRRHRRAAGHLLRRPAAASASPATAGHPRRAATAPSTTGTSTRRTPASTCRGSTSPTSRTPGSAAARPSSTRPARNDGYSITGGHEVMEAITDPIGTGWLDNGRHRQRRRGRRQVRLGRPALGRQRPVRERHARRRHVRHAEPVEQRGHRLRAERRPRAIRHHAGYPDGHPRQGLQPQDPGLDRRRTRL